VSAEPNLNPESNPMRDADQNLNPDQGSNLESNPDSNQASNQRSNWDPVSIGAGIVFFVIGGAYLLASGNHLRVNAGWTLTILALGLGLSGVAGAVLRAWRADRRN
jgi:hypothetical protein